MTDSIITAYSQGGQSFLDAESVTTTVGQGMALRQRVQVSVRDITSGVSTEVGDAANQAIRVNLVAGTVNVSANPNVTITTLGPNFPIVTITGNLNAVVNNVSVTNIVSVSQGTVPWIISGTVTTTGGGGGATPNVTVTNVVSVTQNTTPWTVTYSQGTQIVAGTVTATGVTIQQATVTQGTTPWTVSYSQGTQSVTFTAPTFFPLPATMSSQWPATTTFLPVTFTNPTVTFSAGTQVVTFSAGTSLVTLSGVGVVTFSAGTQAVTVSQIPVTLSQVLASVTQGTSPWVVTYSQGAQAVTFSAGVQSVTFSGSQPVTVTAILQQTIDEQGNLVQRTDQQSLFEVMTIELRAIRLGLQYLVGQMTEAAGSQLDLHESAKELFDSEEVSH